MEYVIVWQTVPGMGHAFYKGTHKIWVDEGEASDIGELRSLACSMVAKDLHLPVSSIVVKQVRIAEVRGKI